MRFLKSKGVLFGFIIFTAILMAIFQFIEEVRLQDQGLLLDEIHCSNTGGIWNDCGSPCRGDDSGFCIEVCEEQCGCITDTQCPSGFSCNAIVEGVGICMRLTK